MSTVRQRIGSALLVLRQAQHEGNLTATNFCASKTLLILGLRHYGFAALDLPTLDGGLSR